MSQGSTTTAESNQPNSEYVLSTLDGNVLLIGGYGAGNIGDEAILRGLLRTATSAIDTLSVVSHDPQETRRLHAAAVPQSVSFNPIDPSVTELASQLLSNTHIVIGGGGIFSRYMGPYAKKIPYYAIAAQTLQRSVHWTAVGVYPSTPETVLTPLRAAMNRSATVTVRDPVSLETLQSHGVSDSRLVSDPATSLSPDTTAGRTMLADLGIDADEPVVGIAARRVLDQQHNERLQQMYRDVAARFISRGWTVVFVPFCRHPYESVEQDDTVCRRLDSRYDSAKRITYTDPEALLGVVSQLDGLVATRLHSLIFAYTAGIPFAAVEYAAKCTSLLDQYGLDARGIALEDVTAERVVRTLDRQLEHTR